MKKPLLLLLVPPLLLLANCGEGRPDPDTNSVPNSNLNPDPGVFAWDYEQLSPHQFEVTETEYRSGSRSLHVQIHAVDGAPIIRKVRACLRDSPDQCWEQDDLMINRQHWSIGFYALPSGLEEAAFEITASAVVWRRYDADAPQPSQTQQPEPFIWVYRELLPRQFLITHAEYFMGSVNTNDGVARVEIRPMHDTPAIRKVRVCVRGHPGQCWEQSGLNIEGGQYHMLYPTDLPSRYERGGTSHTRGRSLLNVTAYSGDRLWDESALASRRAAGH